MKENSAPLIDYTFFFFNLYCHSVARRLARWQVWGVMRHVTGALEWTGVKCFIRGQNRMVRGETRILVSVTQGQEVALTPLPTHLDMNHWHSQWPKWIKKKKTLFNHPKLNDLHFWVNHPHSFDVWMCPFWAVCDQTLIIDFIYILNLDASRIWTLKCYSTLKVGEKGFSP